MSDTCHHFHSSHPVDAPGATVARKLGLVLMLVFLYFVAELAGGWWTGSLALLADAGHMFSDMAALAISLWAAWIVHRPATSQQTFGYHRAETLAALVNGISLLLVAGGILHEAWDRWHAPQAILAGPMLGIALGGLVVNLISLKVLHGAHDHDLNLRGAWLHVLGDALGSLGVIVAALLVWGMNWTWADPLASALVCVLMILSSGRLVLDAARVLLEQAPDNVDVQRVRETILAHPCVEGVHCLHVWSIASGLRALSAHVVIEATASPPIVLNALHDQLRGLFPIEHITLQLETQLFTECQQELECLGVARGAAANTANTASP